MKALLQRVTEASVSVDGELAAEIGAGLLVLLCVEEGDDEDAAVGRGGCRVRTTHGSIDATLETQLERVVHTLLPGEERG